MNEASEDLAQKIRTARERQALSDGGNQPQKQARDSGATAKALRAGTDLVAALMVGAFLGYWTDQWLGSTPWAMIIFIFLGFAAGFLNLYKSQTGRDYKIGLAENTTDNDAKKKD